jgi:hypothetical protein
MTVTVKLTAIIEHRVPSENLRDMCRVCPVFHPASDAELKKVGRRVADPHPTVGRRTWRKIEHFVL